MFIFFSDSVEFLRLWAADYLQYIFKYQSIIYVRVLHILIHSPVDKHLCCFYILVPVSNGALNHFEDSKATLTL